MSDHELIRVMLVDDHAVVRSGLGAFLLAFDDLELVGEAGSGPEAIAKCSQLRPDVILSVLSKLEANTRTEAVRVALENKLVG